MWTRLQQTTLTGLLLLIVTLPGCFRFGASDEREEADAAIRREVAELIKSYRLCLQKHEGNPAKARETCGVYKEALRDLSPESKRSVVGELLDRLDDKDR